MDDFADIARRMKEMKLERDKPFTEPLQPDFHAELNAKLHTSIQSKPSLEDIGGNYWLG